MAGLWLRHARIGCDFPVTDLKGHGPIDFGITVPCEMHSLHLIP